MLEIDLYPTTKYDARKLIAYCKYTDLTDYS
jgi:hypothetical protein